MTEPAPRPQCEIRARFSNDIIRVYQAYSSAIAEPAIRAQKFAPPFKMARITWIKPSFFWMMYRSGWATKTGQERVLAIDIARDGFDWALQHACFSHFDAGVQESCDAWEKQKGLSPVRIQWDPERNCHFERLDYRSIQIGLSGDAAKRYVNNWTQAVIDITETVRELRECDVHLRQAASEEIASEERPYPISVSLAPQIGAAVS
jgi:hypothetical protein